MSETKLTAHFLGKDGTDRVINMSTEAYDNMKVNIDHHLKDMAHDLHAVSYTYFIAGK